MGDNNNDFIFTAIKDLIKYQIIAHTNTGDKTLDNLLNAVFLAILTAVFAAFSLRGILFTISMKFRKSSLQKLDKNTKEYYKKYIKANKTDFTAITWYLSNDKEDFSGKLGYYYATKTAGSYLNDPLVYDLVTGKIGKSLQKIDYFKVMKARLVTNDEPTPLYVCEYGIIAVCKNDNGDVLIMFNNDKAFRMFVNEIKRCEIPLANDSPELFNNTQLKIYSNTTKDVLGEIYPDRNMDMFISKHKETLYGLMRTFQEANGKGSMFGGYGTYNLGIIMQGDPGTGKTLFIKAMCNYFKRDAYIIDMKQVKTRQDFIKIFNDYKSYVYVLDEFDCVQGIIKDRTKVDSSNDERKESNRLRELRDRYMQVLELVAKGGNELIIGKENDEEHEKKKKRNPMMQELENIKTQIADVENALTIDTILTTLDGIDEMRGRIIIATTNHIDKIDPALLREGRFDYKFHLTKFNSNEIKDMLCKMFPMDVDIIRERSYKEYIYTPVQVISMVSINRDVRKVIDILAV